MLAHKGCNLNAQDQYGNTVLNLLLRSYSQEMDSKTRILEDLIIHGADPNLKNHAGEAPLICAIQYCDRHAVNFICDWNLKAADSARPRFNLNQTDGTPEANTALHMACKIPSLSMISSLLACPEVDVLALNKRMQRASQLVPVQFMCSRKIIGKKERELLLTRFKNVFSPVADSEGSEQVQKVMPLMRNIEGRAVGGPSGKRVPSVKFTEMIKSIGSPNLSFQKDRKSVV